MSFRVTFRRLLTCGPQGRRLVWLWSIYLIFQKRCSYYTAPVGYDHTSCALPLTKQNCQQKEKECKGVFQETNFRAVADQSRCSPGVLVCPVLLRHAFLVAASTAVFPGTVCCKMLFEKKCAAQVCELLPSVSLCERAAMHVTMLHTLRPRLVQIT